MFEENPCEEVDLTGKLYPSLFRKCIATPNGLHSLFFFRREGITWEYCKLCLAARGIKKKID